MAEVGSVQRQLFQIRVRKLTFRKPPRLFAADDFAHAVHQTAQRIWNEYGAAGYNEAWNGQRGFPLRALKALGAALSCDDPLPDDADEPSVTPIDP